MKLTLKLGLVGRPEFIMAFRKLRSLALPCAYELALTAGTVEPQYAAYREAHEAAVKRLGEPYEEGLKDTPDYRAGFRVKPENMDEFIRFITELDSKIIELPIEKKMKLGTLTGQLCADDLIPLLEIVEL